jgi:replicative DNA helicase
MVEIIYRSTSGEDSSVELTGPASLATVLNEFEAQSLAKEGGRYTWLPTGFDPLDDILNGGLLPGQLMVIGGGYGVGKTIWGLQVSRNIVRSDPKRAAIYVCYEHDRSHLLSRLLCLESAELGNDPDGGLTLRRLGQIAATGDPKEGLVTKLRKMPRYAPVLDEIESYANRLILVKASGVHSSLEQIRDWCYSMLETGPQQLLLVVDYLQKIPVDRRSLGPDIEDTTYLTQNLKELAMTTGSYVIALAASDRAGLQATRMRFEDLRGSSALQYEADIGMIFNNKFSIVSREHMVYNPTQAETMRNWVIMTLEKNRAGRNAVDVEFPLDSAHFRIIPQGRFVRERLVDDRVTLQ